jgi:hypothetical protein
MLMAARIARFIVNLFLKAGRSLHGNTGVQGLGVGVGVGSGLGMRSWGRVACRGCTICGRGTLSVVRPRPMKSRRSLFFFLAHARATDPENSALFGCFGDLFRNGDDCLAKRWSINGTLRFDQRSNHIQPLLGLRTINTDDATELAQACPVSSSEKTNSAAMP